MDEVWDMEIPDFALSFAPELSMTDLNYQYSSSESAYTDLSQVMFADDGLYPWPFPEHEYPAYNPGSF